MQCCQPLAHRVCKLFYALKRLSCDTPQDCHILIFTTWIISTYTLYIGLCTLSMHAFTCAHFTCKVWSASSILFILTSVGYTVLLRVCVNVPAQVGIKTCAIVTTSRDSLLLATFFHSLLINMHNLKQHLLSKGRWHAVQRVAAVRNFSL